MISMKVAGFYEESVSNGEGWRAVLFVSGCPHQCKGCHNKITWDKDYGEMFNEEKILDSIKSNVILKGLTLSGGEPFLYAKDLIPLVSKVRDLGLDIWAYTGFTLEELLCKNDIEILTLLALTDILVDGKFIEDKKDSNLRFRGSSNQRVIDLNKLRDGLEIEDCIKHYEGE